MRGHERAGLRRCQAWGGCNGSVLVRRSFVREAIIGNHSRDSAQGHDPHPPLIRRPSKICKRYPRPGSFGTVRGSSETRNTDSAKQLATASVIGRTKQLCCTHHPRTEKKCYVVCAGADIAAACPGAAVCKISGLSLCRKAAPI